MNEMILGGGIDGLSMALALKRVGICCQVFEQVPEFREAGIGRTVRTGATRGLRQLRLSASA